MTYRITGLDRAAFAHLIGAPDDVLARHGAVRVTADSKPGAPCRITLEDAEPGETLILINHVSQTDGPYRACHAIFVREGAVEAAIYEDTPPPVFVPRALSLRAFDAEAMMIDAQLVPAGDSDGAIRKMFGNSKVVEIHAHNAVRGCFSARIERA